MLWVLMRVMDLLEFVLYRVLNNARRWAMSNLYKGFAIHNSY